MLETLKIVVFPEENHYFAKSAFSAKFGRGCEISAKMNGFGPGFGRDFGRRYTFWRFLGGLGALFLASFWLHYEKIYA